METRVLNDDGLALIEGQEGLKLVAYKDSGGIWTIGRGHTGPDVHEGLVITLDQANALLRKDAQKFVDWINRDITTYLADPQVSGLCSLVFNCGLPHSIKDLLNTRSPLLFAKWSEFVHDHAGHVLPDLEHRRAKEIALFKTAPWP